MAHFAQIDENNKVIQVLVVPDEQEHRGEEFLSNDLSLGGRWVQTSYNAKIRGKFAGIGDFYDSERDVFVNLQEEQNKVIHDQKIIAKQNVLNKLGITEEEAKLLLS